MAENTAKIIIDATADGVLRAAEQVKKKLKEVGEEGGRAGEKLINGLGRSLLTAGALVAAVKGVAEALNTAAANAAKISRETGGRQLGAEIAGQRLGLNAGQTASVLNATGPRTADERSGFLSSLAGAKGPGGRPLDSGTALEAARIFGEGTVESSEILDALSKRGRRGLTSLADQSRKRIAGLSEGARAERQGRIDEAASALRVSDTSGAEGLRERERMARMEALRAENPMAMAVSDAIGAATSKVGGQVVIEAGQRWADKMLENTRPRLNTNANGPGN